MIKKKEQRGSMTEHNAETQKGKKKTQNIVAYK